MDGRAPGFIGDVSREFLSFLPGKSAGDFHFGKGFEMGVSGDSQVEVVHQRLLRGGDFRVWGFSGPSRKHLRADTVELDGPKGRLCGLVPPGGRSVDGRWDLFDHPVVEERCVGCAVGRLLGEEFRQTQSVCFREQRPLTTCDADDFPKPGKFAEGLAGLGQADADALGDLGGCEVAVAFQETVVNIKGGHGTGAASGDIMQDSSCESAFDL